MGIISATSFVSGVSAMGYQDNVTAAEINIYLDDNKYQVQGKSGFLVKHSMKVTAIILRGAGDIAEYWIRKAGLCKKK